MHKRSILVIAPDLAAVDLPKKTFEIAWIQHYHDATVLAGVVRDVDISNAVAQREYEIIWWITHGGPEGVMLSENVLLSTEAVVQYVKANDTSLCVLNTCDSEEIALRIAAYADADVICTIGKIDNADALRLGQLLAGELAHVTDYQDAYEMVATPESSYRYYPAGTVRGFHRDDEYEELLRLYYKMDADLRILRWTSLVLTGIVLFQAYLMWLLYSKVGGVTW